MKSATKRILNSFPVLEKHLPSNESAILSDQILSNLSEVEQVFLRLIWFFENPNKENFNLESFYKHLDNEWLELALESVHMFFVDDTYLIQNPTHSIITDGDYYMNQSRFAEFLSENGLNYDRSKLGVYIKRGKAPKADITISGTNYWERSTCERFLEEQKNKKYWRNFTST
ncbi:hypothetical protein [Virgibacillus salexigens]|uniref:hypothetical protein n=1 Tax=Virgibacillus salexigens TaxID=61016 RepID=UPI0030816B2E